MGAQQMGGQMERVAAPVSRRTFMKCLLTAGVFGCAASGVARIAYADGCDAHPVSAHADTHTVAARANGTGVAQARAAEPAAVETAAVAQAALDVPCYLQNPELPTGCESVALTNLLRFWGFSLSKTELAVNWVPRSASDFVYAFLGNPFSEDGGCIMAPGLTDAANDFLESSGSDLRASDISGSSMAELLQYVEQGEPVIVWTTVRMQEPGIVLGESDGYVMRDGSHAVVLCGFDRDAGTVTVADSLDGVVERDAWAFQRIYEVMGSLALVIA
jgi:uncharacterized protein YvpB